MKAYMELKDILARTLFGTRVCIIDLATDKVVANITMRADCINKLPREVMEAEPIDFLISDNCLTIKSAKTRIKRRVRNEKTMV